MRNDVLFDQASIGIGHLAFRAQIQCRAIQRFGFTNFARFWSWFFLLWCLLLFGFFAIGGGDWCGYCSCSTCNPINNFGRMIRSIRSVCICRIRYGVIANRMMVLCWSLSMLMSRLHGNIIGLIQCQIQIGCDSIFEPTQNIRFQIETVPIHAGQIQVIRVHRTVAIQTVRAIANAIIAQC